MHIFVGDRFSSAQPTQSLLKLLDALAGRAGAVRSLGSARLVHTGMLASVYGADHSTAAAA